MNVDYPLVSQTLPELVDSEVHSGSSGPSNIFSPPKCGIKMACLNINSLVKHVDELRVFLAEFSFDILAINETKLDESIKSSELHIPGYEFIRRDRNRPIEIRKPNSKPVLVATWYRLPCSPADLFSSYKSFIGKLDSLDLEYYLLGDLNCNLASPTPDANTHRLNRCLNRASHLI